MVSVKIESYMSYSKYKNKTDKENKNRRGLQQRRYKTSSAYIPLSEKTYKRRSGYDSPTKVNKNVVRIIVSNTQKLRVT